MGNNDNNERIERGIKKLTGSDVKVMTAGAGCFDLSSYVKGDYKIEMNIKDIDHKEVYSLLEGESINITIRSEKVLNDCDLDDIRNIWGVDDNILLNKHLKSIISNIDEFKDHIDNLEFVAMSRDPIANPVESPKYITFEYKIEMLP